MDSDEVGLAASRGNPQGGQSEMIRADLHFTLLPLL